MSEIFDEGLLPPNVHHVRPGRSGRPDEEAERAREDDLAPEGPSAGGARRPPHAETAREGRPPRDTDDPYAKPGEDPYGKDTTGAPKQQPGERGDDPGRVDGETGAEGTGDDTESGAANPARPTSEPPD